MATTTISALTAVTAPNLTDVSVFEVEDVNTNSRKVSITQLRVQINTGAQAFTAGATFAGAVSGITTLAGTGAVSGFTTAAFSSTVTVTSNSADMVLNGSSGATSNVERLLFQRGGANKWRVGVNMEGGNADVFGVFSDAAGIYAITASAATGNIFFGASATVTSGFTVSAGTTAVQALTATIATVDGTSASTAGIHARVSGANDKQIFLLHDGTNGVVSSTFTSTGAYSPLVLKTSDTTQVSIATNGAVTFTAGISCTTGTFSGAFGCNGNTAQTKAASGGTLAGVIAALVANGILSS